MKFTLSWLKRYLDTNATLNEILDKLTSIGLEVEEVIDNSVKLKNFKIAKILDAKPHPEADKLQICNVDSGEEKLQIVCGAPNARAGINVVLAPIGTIIPTNMMKIKASKIRGVESNGMLCSAAELGVGQDDAGIIELPACNDNIGGNYAQITGLDDPVIEIAITPNRGDCLGVFGIARDLASAGLGTLKPYEVVKTKSEFKSPIKLNIEDKKACPAFIGRYFKNVKNGPSPEWLKRRLESIGEKSISTLVDITNLIAFAFGRPSHIYDADKLSGNLNVAFAKKDEKFNALDEKEYQLDESILVVKDDKKSQAIAGVIGADDSGVSLDSTNIFLEIALFDPVQVSKSGRKLDIITSSRYRFERNIDPNFIFDAADIISDLIIQFAGGSASEYEIIDNRNTDDRIIDFDFNKVKSLIGIEIAESEICKILTNLGFKIDGNKVTVPSWRQDVSIAQDLVEEVARIYGFDNIPAISLPADKFNFAPILSDKQKKLAKIKRSLAANDFVEAVSWSFMQEDKAKLFGYDNENLKLLNPISSELSVMRPSILPNLIDAVCKNQDRGNGNLALFETGLIYKDIDPKQQQMQICALRANKFIEKNIFDKERNVDVIDIKADLLNALEILNAPVENLRTIQEAPSYYCPGKCATLNLGKQAIAYFGEIHPTILKKMGAKGTFVAFEILFDNLPEARKKSKTKAKLQLHDLQKSTRDFAFIIDDNIPAEELQKIIKTADKNFIESVNIFDVYKGDNIEEGKKSVALMVDIQPKDKNLTDNELDEISNKIINIAEKKLNAKLR